MMDIQKTPLPKASKLWSNVAKGDFIDGYAVPSTLAARPAMELGLAMPWWADRLLTMRNLLMRPFGLKTEVTDQGKNAIFPVVHEMADEVIVGTDDRHLNFRICVRREGALLHMATWVHPHNLFGRAYLAVVMPFHVLIVRNAMARIARASLPA